MKQTEEHKFCPCPIAGCHCQDTYCINHHKDCTPLLDTEAWEKEIENYYYSIAFDDEKRTVNELKQFIRELLKSRESSTLQAVKALKTKDILESYWSRSDIQQLWAGGYLKAIDDVLKLIE